MATTATTTKNSAPAISVNQAPPHSGDNIYGPQSRRASRIASSPWTQVVRGESESFGAVPSFPSAMASSAAVAEPVVPPPSSSSPSALEEPVGESSANGNGLNRDAGKKPAWNKPSNGAAEIGPVMGAVSWPALSESTKASPKPSSESLKSSSVSSGSELQKQVLSNGHASSGSIPNHPVPSRQKSMKHSSAGNSYNGGPSQHSGHTSSLVESPNNPSPKDHTRRSGYASQSHAGNDYPQQRNSFRSRNGGSHPRGDGSHHQNHGVRRDQDRGNQDWNAHRNFNGHPQRVGPRHIRPQPPPPTTVPYIPSPPMRPFGGAIAFPELGSPVIYVAAPHPEPLRGVPFVTPIPHHAVFFPPQDPHLLTKIVNQIDYYFSNENLIKDTYLRQKMDDQGWVPINLIAGFNKVLHLTDNIQVILDAMRASTIVEVQGDRVRRRNDWMRWTMPTPAQISQATGHQIPRKPSYEMLAAGIQSIELEESYSSSTKGLHTEALQSSQLELSGAEGTRESSVEVVSDDTMSARN